MLHGKKLFKGPVYSDACARVDAVYNLQRAWCCMFEGFDYFAV